MTQSLYSWQRPLIVGARGQVGTALSRALRAGGAPEVVYSSREPHPGWMTLDLGKLLRVEEAAAALGPLQPDLIICAGAMTFVDGCEDLPGQAFRVNAYGPAALAGYAHQRGIPFVYFSSDAMFSGLWQ